MFHPGMFFHQLPPIIEVTPEVRAKAQLGHLLVALAARVGGLLLAPVCSSLGQVG